MMERLVRQRRKVGFGVRKKQIMKLLDGVWMTPQQVGWEVGITDGAARHLMRRYQVSGLLSKRFSLRHRVERRGRRAIEYTLSKTGRKVLPMIRTRPRRG